MDVQILSNNDKAMLKLPCGHEHENSVLYHSVWEQTGCDVDGETDTAICPFCRISFTFEICGNA